MIPQIFDFLYAHLTSEQQETDKTSLVDSLVWNAEIRIIILFFKLLGYLIFLFICLIIITHVRKTTLSEESWLDDTKMLS